MAEKITIEDGDAWVCICGNTTHTSGFYPCDEEGNEVEPTPEQWTTNTYVCFQCGRVINQDTLEVVKRVNPDTIQTLD
jgi:hypothetical protein